MSARRREQDRKRARRSRRRAERDRSYAVAVETMRVAREERLARLGPLVEMYGEGSQLLRMIDAAVRMQREPLVIDASFGIDSKHEAFVDRIVADRLADRSLRPIVKRRP